MKTSIMIAAVMITLRLLAEIAPGSHFMWGTWEMPARQPSSGYYGSWYSYAIYDAICYDENGNPYIVDSWDIPMESSWEHSWWNIDLDVSRTLVSSYGNANITWNGNGYVKSKSAYGEDSIDVEIYEVPW